MKPIIPGSGSEMFFFFFLFFGPHQDSLSVSPTDFALFPEYFSILFIINTLVHECFSACRDGWYQDVVLGKKDEKLSEGSLFPC